MKKIATSLTISFLLVCVILVIFTSDTNASLPSTLSQSHLMVSPSITQSITMTTISTVEVSGDFFAVVGNKAIMWNRGWGGEPSTVAFVQPNENPWYHTITTTAVLSVPLSGSMIDVGEGKLYDLYDGNLLLVESDTITTLYRSPEPTNWYRCESDEKYAYCKSSGTNTWSVVSFDTNVPTVIYTTSLTSWGAVEWTARDLLLASVSTRQEGWEIIKVVCITNFATGSRVCHDRVPGGKLALFPHLSTLYLQSYDALYVYSVPTLTLEITAPWPSDFHISAYNRNGLLVHYGIVYKSPDTLYIYQPRQFQPPVLYKEIVVPNASVEAINNSLAVVGDYGTSIIDFTRPEIQVHHYELFPAQPTVVRLRDRLIFAYPYHLSVYSTTAWTENGRYPLSLTEAFTPATDYDHRLLMMGSQHYYLFDFSSYPPEVISGTVSPDVASCLWKNIRGDYAYGTCTPQRFGYMSDRYKDTVYGYPATMRLSSMQIASMLDIPMFGPVVSSDGIYAFVTQTVGTNKMSITLSALSDDPENLSVVQTFSNSIVMPSFTYWNTVDRYDHEMFVTTFDPDWYRYYITRWDLDTQQVITKSLALNHYWAGVDDLYVYVSYVTGQGIFLRGFSHDFVCHYIISSTLQAAGRMETAPPFVVMIGSSYSQIATHPEISLPYRAYLPLVIKQ